MNIKCPYNELTLGVAGMTGASKLEKLLETEEDAKKFSTAFECLPTKAPSKQDVADFHKIPLEMLINSPNMELLINEYYQESANRVINILEQTFSLSNKEAWAIFYNIIYKQY